MKPRIINLNYAYDSTFSRLYPAIYPDSKPWIVLNVKRPERFPTHTEAVAHVDWLTQGMREVP